MQTFGEETSRLKSFIEDRIKHAFVEKFIDKPLIDLDKLSILQFLYSDSNLFQKEKDLYIATIMFVQIALDTHEKVQTKRERAYDETKHQLYVLAGDYYSGLYYKYLAEKKDISMIHRVAKVIKRINEQKMRLYYSEFSTDDEFLRALSDVESLLYTEIAEKLNYSEDVKMAIQYMLLINRLLDEKDYVQHGQFSYTRQYLDYKESCTKEVAVTFLHEQIKYYVNELMLTLALLPYRYQSFKCFVQQKYKTYMNTQAVKEG
ncbi:MAG TPA: heptaprenyl diphosphate synthase component 1 [Pseudogracilibacillus sp.]|nr:heptaprenyl diphosphate synthase component 1 [Pseudogracilibacillus sp.]